MTPLPKKRHSTRRQGKRRNAIHLSLPVLIPCSNCKVLKKPHTVCQNCGFSKGKEVISMKKPKALQGEDENKKGSETSKKDTSR